MAEVPNSDPREVEEAKVGEMVDVEVEHGGGVLINGDTHDEHPKMTGTSKEECEEENALDEEFIKVEKESIDTKDLQLKEALSETFETGYPQNEDTSSSYTMSSLLEAEGKVETLALQLETVVKELENTQIENAQLKAKLDSTEENLKKTEVHCRDLELDCERMKQEVLSTEDRYKRQQLSLHEALETVEIKHRELVDIKESFDGLCNELEKSRNKVKELEADLVASACQISKFEEISMEKGSLAELEAKRALEFQKMLELTKVNEKEMEYQVGNLQEELKMLYYKTEENQQVQDALNSTKLELSIAQEKMEFSESQVANLEQKVVFQESLINELSHELDIFKASDEQMKAKVQSLENLLSASKDDLHSNISQFKEIVLKLQEEKELRQSLEACLKDKETLAQSLQEQLGTMAGQKEKSEGMVAGLNVDLSESKKFCSLLEDKLNQSEQNFGKTDSLLAQALSQNEDLTQKVQFLEEVVQESKITHETSSQKNIDLERVIQACNVAEEETKLLLRETEMKVIAAEKRSVELEEQLTLAEAKKLDTTKEVNGLQEKITNTSTLLVAAVEEVELLKYQLKEYEEKISLLESSLNLSSLRISDLEQEVKGLTETCAENEGLAYATRQRNLELENLIQLSDTKIKNVGKKVTELELSLEYANFRVQELEQLLSIADAKSQQSDLVSKQWIDRVSELSIELEASQKKTARLECGQLSANEKEKELGGMLNVITEEKMMLQESANNYANKLLQAENLIELLQGHLLTAKENIRSIENDLESSSHRERDVLEKLKSAEVQLEYHGREVEQANTRNLELESSHQSLIKDRELKLQEFTESLAQKDSEREQLNEKVKSLEEQVVFYKEQAIDATEKVASLKAELEIGSVKSVELEKTVDDLKRKVAENESNSEKLHSQSEMISDANAKLKDELESYHCKVNELHEQLNSIHAEKEETAEKLASYVNTLAQLTDECSRTESHVKEIEAQLCDAIEKLKDKDSEAKGLKEKLLALESEIINYEVQVKESASAADNHKLELEETLVKLHNLEGLVEDIQIKASKFENENVSLANVNLNLSKDLATNESKLNESQMTLSRVISEKEDASVLLQSSVKAREDLMEELISERQNLQLQISSVIEDNNVLSNLYQGTKKELQNVTAQMEEKLQEQKARENSLLSDMEKLKVDLSTKDTLLARKVELEEQYLLSEKKSKEEIESILSIVVEKEAGLTTIMEEKENIIRERDFLNENVMQLQKVVDLAQISITAQKEGASKKEMELEAAVKNLKEQLESKHQHATLLEKEIEELNQNLEMSETQCKEKDDDGKNLAIAKAEIEELRHRLSQTIKMENKISELENKLLSSTSKVDEQIKDGVSEIVSKDGVGVRSRDIGLSVTRPTKKKSKKRSEGIHAEVASPSSIPVSAVNPGALAFKFVLGVAVVSMIIGIILGKRY